MYDDRMDQLDEIGALTVTPGRRFFFPNDFLFIALNLLQIQTTKISFIKYEDPDYEHVQQRLKNSSNLVSPTVVSKAISKEVKTSGNFGKGEELFQILCGILKEKENSKPGYCFSELDIMAVQRGLSSLIRYAPNVDKARYYFCIALRDLETPLRTAPFEFTILNNLLYVYSVQGSEKYMQDSLDLIEVALEIGVFHIDIPRAYAVQNVHFKDPREVFETLTKKVLRYHRLELNSDKIDLRPVTRLYSH